MIEESGATKVADMNLKLIYDMRPLYEISLYTSLVRDQMRSCSNEKGCSNCYQTSFSKGGERRMGLAVATEGLAPFGFMMSPSCSCGVL